MANAFNPNDRNTFAEGVVVTIEPIIASGKGEVKPAKDGWTIETEDGGIAAHFEHTVVITKGRPMVLTGGRGSKCERDAQLWVA